MANENRRAGDERINQLVNDVHDLRKQMQENTAITLEVRDVLATLRTLQKMAKWVTAISAAIAATVVAIKTGVDFGAHGK